MPALSSPLSAWFLLSRLAEMGILMPLALLVAWRPRKTLWAGWRLWGWWQTARRWMDLVKK